MDTKTTLITAGAGIAAAAGLAITGATFANADAQQQVPAYSTPGYGQAQPGQQGQDGRGQGPQAHSHTAITGETKTKVEAAATAKVSGATVVESRQDPDGSYDVMLKKSDGSMVMVEVSKTFVATVHEGGPGHGRGGHGGPGGHTPLTGTTKTKVEAAATAKVPGTVLNSHAEEDGTYDVLVKKSDGTVVKVEVSKTFTVTAVETAPQRGDHGGMPGQAAQGQTQQGQTQQNGYGPSQLPNLPQGETATAA